MVNGRQMTFSVHPRFEDKYKIAMKYMSKEDHQDQLDAFIDIFTTNLEELIESLSRLPNVHVTAIINCCRVILDRKIETEMGATRKEPGSLTICFAVQNGGKAKQDEEK